jgi:hypothetical protein
MQRGFGGLAIACLVAGILALTLFTGAFAARGDDPGDDGNHGNVHPAPNMTRTRTPRPMATAKPTASKETIQDIRANAHEAIQDIRANAQEAIQDIRAQCADLGDDRCPRAEFKEAIQDIRANAQEAIQDIRAQCADLGDDRCAGERAPTVTLTATPCTPTCTPTTTPTATATGTITPTGTSTATASPTATITETPTATATGTLTATGTAPSAIANDSNRKPKTEPPGAIAGVVNLVVQDLAQLLGI